MAKKKVYTLQCFLPGLANGSNAEVVKVVVPSGLPDDAIFTQVAAFPTVEAGVYVNLMSYSRIVVKDKEEVEFGPVTGAASGGSMVGG